MPFPISARNLMLDALVAAITHVGTYQADAAVSASVTATASTDVINKTAHGLADGDLVTINAATGGTGLVIDRPYWVVSSTANTFKLATAPAGTAIDITADYSAVTYQRFIETTGGTYGRIAIAFAASAGGIANDSTNGAAVNQPAANKVDAVGLFSASTAGTMRHFKKVTQATDSSAWVFSVTDYQIDLNSVF